MGRIEVLWGIVIAIFVLISIARGYHKELGSTVVILVALAALKLLDSSLSAAIKFVFPGDTQKLASMILFQVIFIAIVFAGYSGETLIFKGQPRRGSSALFFNIVFGLLNGILVAGTLWYYLAINGYPLPKNLFDASQLSKFANDAIQYLPPKLPTQSLVALLIFLLILRVRK